MDVDADSLLIILEQLDFENILAASKVNRYFNHIVNYIFRCRFRAIEINMYTKDWTIMNNVLVTGTAMAEPILKHFGHSILRLSIIFNDDSATNQTQFGHLINSCCSDSMNELKVIACNDDFFDAMQIPFKQTTSISISGVLKKSHHKLELDELFPKMYNLHLNLEWESRPIVRHFSNLIELDIIVAAHHFVELLQMNPQIRKLKCKPLDSTEFLQIVNEHLPNLEQIEIGFSSFKANRGPDIHFENVKKIKISDMRSQFTSEKLTFDRLEEFHLELDSYFDSRDIGDEWIEFLEDNANLTKFTMAKGYVSAESLQRISGILNHLKEASIVCTNATPLDDILTFLNSNANMKRFKLKYTSKYPSINSNATLCSFNEALGHAWNIISNDADWSITILRKDFEGNSIKSIG